MTTPILKIKVTPKPTIKGKMDVRFPAKVEAESPILLDKAGGKYVFSFDADAFGQDLPISDATQAALDAKTDRNFTQDGDGAVPITFDALLRDIVVTPEMFGGYPGLAKDATDGIQRAIDFLADEAPGGVVRLSNSIYVTTKPLRIRTKGITIEGQVGSTGNGTEIYFTPSAAGQSAIDIVAPDDGRITNVTIKNLAIRSPDTTTYKTAITATDGSYITFRDLFIYGFTGGASTTITGAAANGSGEIRLAVSSSSDFATGWAAAVSNVVGTTEANFGWPITVVDATHIDLKGSTFTNAYVSGGTLKASSTGIQLKGRELFQSDYVSISADLPLRISVNPNNSVNSLDQSVFSHMSMAATGTNPVIMADDGVVISSVKFLGTQSWGGGKDGFAWRDRSSPSISQQLRFDNVRAEQKSVAGGTYFNIRPNNSLYSLHIIDPLMSDRDGFFLRNVVNWQLDNSEYSGTGKALDINSTVQLTQINGCYWAAGSTATLTGQTLLFANGKNPTTGALPPFATYSSTRARNKSAGLDVDDTVNCLGLVQSGGQGVTNGSFVAQGVTSGSAILRAQSVQGSPTVLFPTGSGTMAVSATAPLVLNSGTGNLTISAVVSIKKQVFTSSGTYTPSTGMLYAVIEGVGGGAGGGGAVGSSTSTVFIGGGGGAGAYSRVLVTAALVGASQTVTIAAAGTGGAAGANNGTAGGDASVGTLFVAKGGSPGTFSQSGTRQGVGGAGGVAGTSDILSTGAAGQNGAYVSGGTVYYPAGAGASSPYGGGGNNTASFNGGSTGASATGYGAGGAGGNASASASSFAGGNGSPPVVIITEYCSQ